MALLFMDSFDHYVTADLTTKWTTLTGTAGNFTISAGTGRRGSASLHGINGATLQKAISPATTLVCGFALKQGTLAAARPIAGFYDGVISRDQLQLVSQADGSLSVYRQGAGNASPGQTPATLLGSSAAGVISAGAVPYLELKVFTHATLGTAEIRVNNTTVLSLTGLNTINGASTGCNIFWLSTPLATLDFDDVYLCDGTGAAPWNTFLGDCRVDARMPTAAGATTGWTPLAGANWDAVNDAAPDGDTTYTAAASVGLTDTFVTQDAPVVGAVIYGVQHCVSLKKTDAGVCTVVPVIRHSGVDYPGADINPGTTYAYGLRIAAVHPGTGAAWTEAGFNAAEFGYKRTV